MSYCPELTVLGFVLNETGDQVLMVHRIARQDDEQLGKWNGLGGKVEPGESIWEAMAREIAEEAELEVHEMQLRGTVAWPGFHRDGFDVFGFIFLITKWDGTPPPANAEGKLAWQPIEKIPELNMWAGDRYFMPHVFDPNVGQFHLVIPYLDGEVQGCSGVVQ